MTTKGAKDTRRCRMPAGSHRWPPARPVHALSRKFHCPPHPAGCCFEFGIHEGRKSTEQNSGLSAKCVEFRRWNAGELRITGQWALLLSRLSGFQVQQHTRPGISAKGHRGGFSARETREYRAMASASPCFFACFGPIRWARV